MISLPISIEMAQQLPHMLDGRHVIGSYHALERDEIVVTRDYVFASRLILEGVDYKVDECASQALLWVLSAMVRDQWWKDLPTRTDGRVFFCLMPKTDKEIEHDRASLKKWASGEVLRIKAEAKNRDAERAGVLSMF